MKCRECEKEGKTSVLFGGDSCLSTLMCTSSFYDEQGNRHFHDPNGHTYSYRCSNGHSYSETEYSPCPHAECDRNKPASNGAR